MKLLNACDGSCYSLCYKMVFLRFSASLGRSGRIPRTSTKWTRFGGFSLPKGLFHLSAHFFLRHVRASHCLGRSTDDWYRCFVLASIGTFRRCGICLLY